MSRGGAVDRAKEMLGTFSPQLEPYTYVTPEDTTPSGMFARGSYSARTKVNCNVENEVIQLIQGGGNNLQAVNSVFRVSEGLFI